MDRRTFLAAAAAAGAIPGAAWAQTGFDFDALREIARGRSGQTFRRPEMALKPPFANLTYDAFRAIRVAPDHRLWTGEGRGFTADLLPPGFFFKDGVAINLVEDGAARPIPFSADRFEFDPSHFDLPRNPDGTFAVDASGAAFSGLRLRHPINRPDVEDEVVVFQGASYFRAIARNQIYGLSARGLAIGAGSAKGEEFPLFTEFWLRRPDPGAVEATVWALLDSPSCAGAFEFTVRPGGDTTLDVRSALFPRVDIAEAGIAPLTSMYMFSAMDRRRVDDHRDAVHDSHGLQMLTGGGERIWRQLANPATLQMSWFGDVNPRGFGLAQRARDFAHYQDAEARYDRRPSAWIAPKGDWGPGGVMLLEIPTTNEFNDNIVAFWRPEAPLRAGAEARHDYRVTWSDLPPDEAPVARVADSRSGDAVNDPSRVTVSVDFDLGDRPAEGLSVEMTAERGGVEHPHLTALPVAGRVRASALFTPPGDGVAELRLRLLGADGAPASETWLYRWSPS
jgi:glucans biosynthesis protein